MTWDLTTPESVAVTLPATRDVPKYKLLGFTVMRDDVNNMMMDISYAQMFLEDSEWRSRRPGKSQRGR